MRQGSVRIPDAGFLWMIAWHHVFCWSNILQKTTLPLSSSLSKNAKQGIGNILLLQLYCVREAWLLGTKTPLPAQIWCLEHFCKRSLNLLELLRKKLCRYFFSAFIAIQLLTCNEMGSTTILFLCMFRKHFQDKCFP